MPPSERLTVGDEINATILKSIGGRRFLARSAQAPSGWSVELHARSPKDVELGSHGVYWVARITPVKHELLIRDGSFGRLPISDSMRPRYIAGLKGLLGQEELTSDTLADVRSMINRIDTQDQADWLSVWRLIGEPTFGETKRLITDLTELRRVRKEEVEQVPVITEKIHFEWKDRLGYALAELIRRQAQPS